MNLQEMEEQVEGWMPQTGAQPSGRPQHGSVWVRGRAVAAGEALLSGNRVTL